MKVLYLIKNNSVSVCCSLIDFMCQSLKCKEVLQKIGLCKHYKKSHSCFLSETKPSQVLKKSQAPIMCFYYCITFMLIFEA